MSTIVACPDWEYENFPGYPYLLNQRTPLILRRLRAVSHDVAIDICRDTRPLHREYFEGLTPSFFDHYAGHYRGEPYPCLLDYCVGVQGDPSVGHDPSIVVAEMYAFARSIDSAIRELDAVWKIGSSRTPAEKLLRTIKIAAAIFVYFLEIHPYVNGNGHMARFSLICILSRFDIHLSKFPLHPRTKDSRYGPAIFNYRRSNKADLEQFLLDCI